MSEVVTQEFDLSGILYPEAMLLSAAEGFETITFVASGDKRFEVTGEPDEIHKVIREIHLRAGLA
ncbi:MAG: hypothetical protein PHW75_01805 [Patescibacteria group bacterium]|nr:hypothetical protein [Patescibacteria group bacterium]